MGSMADPAAPVIIEAAINGGNPTAPRTPDEIAACTRACIDAGAAIVHNHIDIVGDATTVAARYREGWDPVLADRPDALLYPTINGVGDPETRFCHITPLAESGVLRIGIIDPGSVNLGPGFAYVNSGDSIEHQASLCERFDLGPTIAIFEPGFLRAALSLLAQRAAPLGCDDPVLLRRHGAGGRRQLLVRDAAHGAVARRVPRHARRLPDPVVGVGARR